MKRIPLVKRRDFVKGSLAMGSLLFLPKNILAQGASPNGKVNLALVGAGQQGGINLKQMATLPTLNLVALCDADTAMRASVASRVPELPADTPFFQRYAEMLDKLGKQIDAVFVATPDHAHFHIAMAMLKAGKHVMIEKPLTQTVAEARQLRDAAREAKVVTQMGNQGHAGDGWRLLKEWWEAGVLGPVRRVVIAKTVPPWKDKRLTFTTAVRPSGQTPPATLDWELYLGPRPDYPYSPDIHPGVWRRWWHFGSGMMGDFGCHLMDISWRALDLGAPESVTAESRGATEFTFPTGNRITFQFPARGGHPPVELLWMDGDMIDTALLAELAQGDKGVETGDIGLVIGEKGTVAHSMYASHVRFVPESRMKELFPTLPPKSQPRIKGTILTDWLAGIREGTTPCSNFEISGPLTEVVQLGNVATRAGGAIRWDTKNLTTGNAETDRFIHPPGPRDGWNRGG